MVSLIGGDFYQWDTGRIIIVTPETDAEVHEVHFTTKRMDSAYVVSTYKLDETVLCSVPNIILQQERPVICYEVVRTDEGEMSISETSFNVHKRNKPQDYVYTETEVINYDTLANTSLSDKELSSLIAELDGGE